MLCTHSIAWWRGRSILTLAIWLQSQHSTRPLHLKEPKVGLLPIQTDYLLSNRRSRTMRVQVARDIVGVGAPQLSYLICDRDVI